MSNCIQTNADGAMVFRKQLSGAVESTKDGLKKRGLSITENGMSVKTEKRLDRDDYIGGTGRLKKRGLDITENGMSVKTEGRLERDDYIGDVGRNLVDALKATSFGAPDNRAAVSDMIGHGRAPPGTRHRSSLSKKN
ncbi:unnamed protein product [Rhizoctonia solani]|uniref:Uncharacterized protein n=1 Tax=Rhizoctonia solani TaxID=456999 RepID=A0A8H3AJM3_9AGAM|nr:unnamed protein product [Rhizoctonia solani]